MAGTYMDVPLCLRYDDGSEVRLTARPRDLMAWQKNSRSKVTLADVLPVNDAGTGLDIGKFVLPELYRLAWMVARREGEFGGTLEEFGQQVDVSVMDDDEEGAGDPVPTNAAPSAASSPSSPSPPVSPRRSGQKRAPEPS